MDDQTRQATRLWTLAQPTVSAFVLSVVRDFTVRDDVLQETAIAVIESFPRYDASRSFSAWAIGIAQNQIRLYWRKQKSDRLVFDEDVVQLMSETFEETSEEDISSMKYLRECLSQLEGRAREMIEMRYHRNLKPAVMAEPLGMSANTVAKTLQRIRDQLRTCIERKNAIEGWNP